MTLYDRLMQTGIKQGIDQGIKQGEINQSIIICKNLLAQGMEENFICSVLEVNLEFLEKVKNGKLNNS